MFEKFTDRARKIMALANMESQRLNHEYIGTEHILLGLLGEGSGTGALVLKNRHIDPVAVRLEIERLLRSGPNALTVGKLPQTARAKKVIEFAIEEARNLGHNYLGTEHLLLGLLREKEGIAALVLTGQGLNVENARQEIHKLLSPSATDDPRLEFAAAEARQMGEWSGFAWISKLAFHEATKAGLSSPQAGHLLLAVLGSEDPVVMQALAGVGVKPDALRAELQKLLAKPGSGGPPQ